MTRILGIDPGTRACGWGVIDWKDGANFAVHVASGVLRPPASRPSAGESKDACKLRLERSMLGRLCDVATDLASLAEQHKPARVAIEGGYAVKGGGAKGAIQLGMARGVAIAAAAGRALPVALYAPTAAKAYLAHGGATKAEMKAAVAARLHLPKLPPQDAADALAIALLDGSCGGARDGRKNQ